MQVRKTQVGARNTIQGDTDLELLNLRGQLKYRAETTL